MKDKHAVTRQWLSVPGQARPPEAWHLPEFARLLSVSRHKNKLRTGHLRANRFHITLVDVPDGGLQRARDVLTALQDGGLPNYFGPQRFGKAGSSFAQAFEWMRQSQERSPSGGRPRRGGRFETKFLSSVIQSDLFNRYLTARLERREPLLTGEVVRLAGTSRLFVVEDVQQELPRLQQGDIHRTGPILGPRTVQAAGEAAALEASLIEQLGLSEADRQVLAGAAPGARRDLLITPEELAVVSPEPGQLVVSFVLPAGSYATQLIRELTRSPWFEIR